VHGCYAHVLAPTSGVIFDVEKKDKWDEKIDSPGTRGGLTITLHGDDRVRYYFSHLGRVKVNAGNRKGINKSPIEAKNRVIKASPQACELAAAED
jgi:hypothetical protein